MEDLFSQNFKDISVSEISNIEEGGKEYEQKYTVENLKFPVVVKFKDDSIVIYLKNGQSITLMNNEKTRGVILNDHLYSIKQLEHKADSERKEEQYKVMICNMLNRTGNFLLEDFIYEYEKFVAVLNLQTNEAIKQFKGTDVYNEADEAGLTDDVPF